MEILFHPISGEKLYCYTSREKEIIDIALSTILENGVKEWIKDFGVHWNSIGVLNLMQD